MRFVAIHGNCKETTKRVVDAVLIDLLTNHDSYMSSLHSDHCQRQVLATMCPELVETIYHGRDDDVLRTELYGLSIQSMLDRITKLGIEINANYWLYQLEEFIKRRRDLIVISRDDLCLPLIDCEVIALYQNDADDVEYPWVQPPYAVVTSRSRDDLAAPITQLKKHILRLTHDGR